METITSVLNNYPSYQEKTLTNRFFKHSEIERLIHQKNQYSVMEAGKSLEGRSIYLLKRGSGPVKVFLWSQMHGDEPTATMTLFDLFNFLDTDDQFDGLRQKLLTECTLYFAPMINPDGAEVFTRRNAQILDINRDYLHQQTPEGRILRRLRDEIEPHFGFNLHDQSIRWSAGKSGNPAAISFLSPAYDDELSVNPTRRKAMQIITRVAADIHPFIPGHIGRFEEEYESRAFGDNFQKVGTSTILIEAGGYINDREKQFLRKIYFGSILSGLINIAGKDYENEDVKNYYFIPENKKRHFSMILRSCSFTKDNYSFTADIGLVAIETTTNGTNPLYLHFVEDIGDLSEFYSYHEVDAKGLNLILTKPLAIDEPADLILQNGNTTILSIENGRLSD